VLFVETRAPQGYPDLVQYDTLIAPGVMLLKGGALLAAWAFVGPDMEAATEEELAANSAHFNAAAIQMGDGWMSHFDLQQTPAQQYPVAGAFPDPTSWLIDEERRRQYQAEGAHYESTAAFALTYALPQEATQSLTRLFVKGGKVWETPLLEVLERFEHHLAGILDVVGTRLRVARLEDDDLLTYLHRCATGLMHRVAVPAVPTDIDALIASEDFTAGLEPKVGRLHLRTVAVPGIPIQTHPAMLSFLGTLPCVVRWNTRFIFLDPHTASNEITRYRVRWTSKVQSIIGSFVEWATGAPPRYVNEDARNMAQDANDAKTLADSGTVRFGFPTTTVTIYHEDARLADEYARVVVKELQNHGFPARVEWLNATEAFLGSLPGHGYQNVRKPMLHTLNLADLLPLTSTWPGLETNPNPMFPPGSPALMYTATNGVTPFRLNLHVSDVGHALIVGPIGSGKTTKIDMLMAQWLRYLGAQIRCFTRDLSSQMMTAACGGVHYTLGADQMVALCPLGRIDEAGEQAWAAEWIEAALDVQGVTITPGQRNEIARALALLATQQERSLTDFVRTVQDFHIREALVPYTLEGTMGWLLDATEDGLTDSHFQTFDMTALMDAPKQLVPVLLYLFHRIDQSLDGRPFLIPIDEAWMTLLHQKFADQVEKWVRTLRKKNAAVIFVTQSLADLATHPRRALIKESCQTKIFLPNPEARSPDIRAFYADMGLNDKQIDLIATALMKKHYYYTSTLGSRLYDAALGPVALAFAGVVSDEDRRTWQAMAAEDPACWPARWLEHRGLPEAAHRWREIAEKEQHA
jgi:type IV secretion system protein VirB4